MNKRMREREKDEERRKKTKKTETAYATARVPSMSEFANLPRLREPINRKLDI